MTAGCFSFRLFSRAGRSLLIPPPRQWLVPAPSFLPTPLSLFLSLALSAGTSSLSLYPIPPDLSPSLSRLLSRVSLVLCATCLPCGSFVSYVSEARCLGALAGRDEGRGGLRTTGYLCVARHGVVSSRVGTRFSHTCSRTHAYRARAIRRDVTGYTREHSHSTPRCTCKGPGSTRPASDAYRCVNARECSLDSARARA